MLWITPGLLLLALAIAVAWFRERRAARTWESSRTSDPRLRSLQSSAKAFVIAMQHDPMCDRTQDKFWDLVAELRRQGVNCEPRRRSTTPC